ncbi:MAG TPA: FtsK/SpoIIIE domain-containing protein [Acidimicrobiales bacterium]|nr:FtsK/SpoIIIE domain-containing protein [Acidimicrobiales bacterium]
MHILLDGDELEVTANDSARVADLAPQGCWIDGRYRAPDEPLELYEGAVLTTFEPRPGPETAYVLDIVGGLRAGRSFPLPRRPVIVGRAPGCDIVLDDPTVSPHHAVIDEHHRISDLGSVNGTWTYRDDLICFGATQARIRARRIDTRGPGPYNRPPRPPIAEPEPPPEQPERPEAVRGVGLAAIVGPALMGGALVVVYRDPRFALLALIGPAVALMTLAGSRRSSRKNLRRHRRAVRAYERALLDHFERECRRLEGLAPDPCAMTGALWARRPTDDDFGLLRLGLRGHMPVVADGLHGKIGVAGDQIAARALARALVCQVAAHHGPADVRIEVPGGPDWDWAKWLPHRTAAPWTFSVAIAATEEDLPASCTTVVRVNSDLGDAEDFIACGMDEPTARAFARGLARFEDPETTESATLPHTVRLSSLNSHSGVPIGSGKDGVVEIDLVRDGPHGLIAGTTGSGKSELLRTLVVGLAARHTPDEMVFVLIDYKGGSAFDDCALLPHCVGLVTDLDEQLGERALRSLEAELRFRERDRRDDTTKLPRLVVVIDEFATLATELPDFLGALVGIAQRGRSLGMHLVLATQRPSGVVNANIKANANLRIALRVQDATDSIDVIDSPEAASISRDTPGRAYIRRGSGDVVLVQTATASLPAAIERAPVTVRPFPSTDTMDSVDGPTELAVLVEALRAWRGPLPRRPWLPMLPPSIDLGDIEPPAFALADEPDHQRQVPVAWQLDQGNLVLYGMAGSGTTTAMRAVLERLPHAQIYAVDFGTDAHERHARLMRTLRLELERRRATGECEPRIVTCVDNVGTFLAEHDGIDGIEVTETFHRLFGEGSPFGISFVVTADRISALPLRLSSLVSQKLLFRLADPHDYALVGLRPNELPAFVAGRAVHSDGNRVVQVGMPRRQIKARTIRTMPSFVSLGDLPPGAVGIDEDFDPVFLEMVEHVLIAGPPRSGKTTALRTMACVLPHHLFVDDAAAVDAVELTQPVVAAARTDDVRGSYGHWLREVRKSRTGLLLQPDLSSDGDLLGVQLPRRSSTPFRPGRGFLVERGEARLVQIATSDR